MVENHLPLYSHGSIKVEKINKQLLEYPEKVLSKIRDAAQKDISYMPIQNANTWRLLDVDDFLKSNSLEHSTYEAKVITNKQSFLSMLKMLSTEKLIIVVDENHSDKILSVVNAHDIVESKTIHAHLYLILLDLESKLRDFFEDKSDYLEKKMRQIHPEKSKRIDKERGSLTRDTHPTEFKELISVQYLAEIYARFFHPILGKQSAHLRVLIYDLRTNLVHRNSKNMDNIDISGKVIDTVEHMYEMLRALNEAKAHQILKVIK